MLGTIKYINKRKGSYFFIAGDDGEEYFGCLSKLKNPSQYCRYCWKGNRAVFDVAESEVDPNTDRRPVAVNIVLASVSYPGFSNTSSNKVAKQYKYKSDNSVVEKSDKKSTLHRDNHRNTHRHTSRNLRYVLQVHRNSEWLNVYENEKLVMFTNADEGNAAVKQYHTLDLRSQYRIKKMIVHTSNNKIVLKSLDKLYQ